MLTQTFSIAAWRRRSKILGFMKYKGERGKKGNREQFQKTILFIYPTWKTDRSPNQCYRMSPRLSKISIVPQPHNFYSLKKLYRPQNPYKQDAQVGEHAWTGWQSPVGYLTVSCGLSHEITSSEVGYGWQLDGRLSRVDLFRLRLSLGIFIFGQFTLLLHFFPRQ